MKILIDATSVGKGGGVDIHIRSILKNFSKDFEYFILISDINSKNLIKRDDFFYIHLKFFNRFTKIFYEQFIFPVIVLFYRIDLLYLPKQNSNLIKFCKIVSTIHDFIPEKKGSKENILTRVYWKFEYHLISRRSDGIIFITKNCMKIYKKRFKNLKRKKYRVVYNGFDTFKRLSTQNEKYILIPSTIKTRKNIELSLKVASDISRFYPDKKIIITGRMDDWKIGKILKNFDYRGFLDFEEFERIFNETFLVIYLSSDEGFSLPVGESLYLNKRVVCMDISVHRELYGERPIYWSLNLSYEENIKKIVQKLKGEVIDDGKIKRWEESSKRTEEFFEYFKR